MARNKNSLAKRGNAEIEAAQQAAMMAGQESAAVDFGREDIAIPRLTILQTNSPQVLTRENSYVEDAEPGMIYDSVGNELWDGENGIVIQPIHYRRTFVEWITRENGAGFVADHGLEYGNELLPQTQKDDKGRDILPNGNQLNNTMEYVVHRLTEEGPQQCIINMGSTQLKKGRNWNPNIMKPLPGGVPATFYSRAFRFTTIPESNAKGNWFGWAIKFECYLWEFPAHGYKWCDLSVDKNGHAIEPNFSLECAAFRQLLVDNKLRFTPPTAPATESSENDPERL